MAVQPPLQNPTSTAPADPSPTGAGQRFLRYWLPLVLYAAAIFIESSFPTPDVVPSLPHIDKLLHVLAYAVFGALCYRALTATGARRHRSAIFLSVIMAAAYGISDEIHQSFVPGRSPEMLDVLADAVGGLLGGLGWHRWRARARSSARHLQD